jgi:hypothetical protein
MINELGMMPISILLEKPVNRYVFITLTFLFASHAAEAEAGHPQKPGID